MHENVIDNDDTQLKIVNVKTDKIDQLTSKNRATKIIDLIKQQIHDKQRFFSIEVSPLKSLELDYNEFGRQPLFTAVTWLSDTNLIPQNERLPPSLEMASVVSRSAPVLTHLSCYKLSMPKFNELMRNEIGNILALRGDFVDSNQPMKHASDLVRSIKDLNKSICIAVGGYPEIHPEAESEESDLHFLKEKVDAGASFIITQTCFSAEKILQFIQKCRDIDIKVPILPGIFVPFSFRSLVAMCNVCKCTVPEDIFEEFKLRKDNGKEFQKYSAEYIGQMIGKLFENDPESIPGVHFFTLNKFSLIKEVLEKLEI